MQKLAAAAGMAAGAAYRHRYISAYVSCVLACEEIQANAACAVREDCQTWVRHVGKTQDWLGSIAQAPNSTT